MRWIILAIMLAGCTAEPAMAPDDPSAPEPTSDGQVVGGPRDIFEPGVLVRGDFSWHEPAASPSAAIGQVEAAGQTVVPGCLDPATGEPDGWNLPLPAAPVDNGTTNLAVLLSWDPAAYLRDELVLAYLPAGQDRWQISEYITNGQNATIPVDPEGWDDERPSWDFAVCLVREEHRNIDAGPAWRPGSFRGVLHVEIRTL